MFDVDLRYDRFMKVWRVTGRSIQATAAVIRRPSGFSAVIRYARPNGRVHTWYWRGKEHSLLSGREVVQCIYSLDRGLRSIPGEYLRVDFPQGSSRADQVVLLMEYDLLDLAPGAATPPEMEEGCRS